MNNKQYDELYKLLNSKDRDQLGHFILEHEAEKQLEKEDKIKNEAPTAEDLNQEKA